MAEQLEILRNALQRTKIMLDKVTGEKNRLQYEMDNIHHKHGTYRIICHLRNEIQRLTISKLLLIQSTALEIDRLRTIIRTLSKGEDFHNIPINTRNDYSQSDMLHELLPPPTPTSPPAGFSWQDTFNIDLVEDDPDIKHEPEAHHILDEEDDIKIPEMNLDLEDGAMNPISLIHRQSSDGDDSDNDENESNDENDYVIERVASPEASHNINYTSSDSEQDNEDIAAQIASPSSAPLLADIDIMNSEDTATNSDVIPDQYDDDGVHHSHPSHDASPQLQFAGDGIDLNRIHGVATDAPILEPSTNMKDIYGEEDHKFAHGQDDMSSDEDEKLGLDDLEQDVLDETNVSLQNNDDMEELELISEMGDDDRNPVASSPTPNINMQIEQMIANESNEDEKDDRSPLEHTRSVLSAIKLPGDVECHDSLDEDDMSDVSDERNDILADLPQERLPVAKTKLKYDVSMDRHHHSHSPRTPRTPAGVERDDYKPRRPLPPHSTPSEVSRSFRLNARNVSLFNGLRMGEMDVHIDICSEAELRKLISIICRAMTLLPFGLAEFRKKLEYSLQKRMCASYELTQHFTFFLNSYRDCFAISRLFKDSVCMESIVELEPLHTLVVRPVAGHHVSTPTGSRTFKSRTSIELTGLFDISETEEKQNEEDSNPFITEEVDRIEYSGCNVVEFFRLPLLYPDLNQIFCATRCTQFICPITWNESAVTQLQIRKIYNSNAKPLLVDCYTDHSTEPISSFILKYGDDLRRDAAVLLMFQFMNHLWIENAHRYNNKQIAALTYKCFPLGPDYGVIELIPNCQTLKDITDKYVHQNKRNKDQISDDVMHNIIATCAGSYMAAYIMGIRDRHYDNVLVTDSGTIFHIDFGYMLGEKVSGIDTSKFAITSDLAKLMGNKWKEFVQISVQCWVILRENHQELLEFAKLAFSFIYPQEVVQEFLKQTLLLELSVEAGKQKINKRLLQAPKKLKTKLKNFVHAVASSSARERSKSPSAPRHSRRSRSPSRSRPETKRYRSEPPVVSKPRSSKSKINNIFNKFSRHKRETSS
eukprot:268809_1